MVATQAVRRTVAYSGYQRGDDTNQDDCDAAYSAALAAAASFAAFAAASIFIASSIN